MKGFSSKLRMPNRLDCIVEREKTCRLTQQKGETVLAVRCGEKGVLLPLTEEQLKCLEHLDKQD